MISRSRWPTVVLVIALIPFSLYLAVNIFDKSDSSPVIIIGVIIAIVSAVAFFVSWVRRGAGMQIRENFEIGAHRLGRVVGIFLGIFAIYKSYFLLFAEYNGRYEDVYFFSPSAFAIGFLTGKIIVRAFFWIREAFL